MANLNLFSIVVGFFFIKLKMRGQLNPPIPIILQSITTKKDKRPESSAHATNIKTKSAKEISNPPQYN